jgi:hypothetical protein
MTVLDEATDVYCDWTEAILREALARKNEINGGATRPLKLAT